MAHPIKTTLVASAISLLAAAQVGADGIVSTIVNAPLSATGTVAGARTGINVYLQTDAKPGAAFMDPAVPGYGIPAGGQMEIEMGGGFERDWGVGLSQASIILVTGAPQQGLPGAKVGYDVVEEDNENLFIIRPTGGHALTTDVLVSLLPGAAQDPIRQRGIKVIHIGFRESAFVNAASPGTVTVRIRNGADTVVAQGSETLEMIAAPVPQILPTNFPQGMRNHNWQRVKPGDVLGQTEGTVPITAMLYDKAPGTGRDEMYAFKKGITGAGVLSTPQLKAMGFTRPDSMARYNGGLIVQDTTGDGALDPNTDRIIGGVIASAPAGARGQELTSLQVGGKPMLSQPTETVVPKAGARWGGAILQLQFTAGSQPGLYRPTLALLADPENPGAGDGAAYTYTIVVE